MIRIAQLSCGSEYSGVQGELEKAAEMVGAELVFLEVSLEDVRNVEERFGIKVASGDLNLAMARATRIVENPDLGAFRQAVQPIYDKYEEKFGKERLQAIADTQ